MKIDILTIFPEMFSILNQSILGKAQEKGIIDLAVTDFRLFTDNKHNNVDDYPFGGGAGMLLTPQPIFDAIDNVKERRGDVGHVILLDPAGEPFNQKMAQDLATKQHLTFIAGHYEGYDERIKTLVDQEISIGDYVLTGGELAAMVVIDATTRYIDGVLGNQNSAGDDSFSDGLLEAPQYTKPREFRDLKVPEVLISGNHQKIEEWRLRQSILKTLQKRPDLIENGSFDVEIQELIKQLKNQIEE